ncbi:MAG TPA: lipoyl(octanoyl) transferase LipB [Candidatus Micrarchaeia archaeon]|nr:lipoyl(octanoyl) transferase LipB [Candidatus Micrarchaeia archaeon]
MAGVWRPPLRVLWCGRRPYGPTWAWQRELAAARAAGSLDEDVLLLVEHPPVYTMGRGGRPSHLGAGEEALRATGAEYFAVDRGGSATYHGPGQLVGYPIVHLAPLGLDVIAYLRQLEEALIDTCALCGVEAFRDPPHTGVWHRTGKLAAIGVRLSRGGVTYHGFALNGTVDCAPFERIVPCGIDGRTATSLERCGASRPVDPESLAKLSAPLVAHALGLRAVAAGAAELPAPQGADQGPQQVAALRP